MRGVTFLLLHLIFVSPCFSESQQLLSLESGEKIKVLLALSSEEKKNGLSGIQENDFKDDQGMLFYYKETKPRVFWMPHTYFDLDLFFLDENFKVIDIERDVPHYPIQLISPSVPRTREITCRHVLELKSSSPLAKKINIGDKLVPSKSIKSL